MRAALILFFAAMPLMASAFLPVDLNHDFEQQVENFMDFYGSIVYWWTCWTDPLAPYCDPNGEVGDRDVIPNDLQSRLTPEGRAKVQILLYTPTNKDTPDRYDPEGNNIDNANLDPSLKTIVLMHGWNQEMGLANEIDYLSYRDANVFVILWKEMQSAEDYHYSAHKTLSVADYVGTYLSMIIQQKGINQNDVHLIGFSLGAHGVGEIGRTIGQWTGTKVGRITGLDAAAAYFQSTLHKSLLLSPDNGQFVDAVHTYGGYDTLGHSTGWVNQLGKVDFYPNGGESQPGCLDDCKNDSDGCDINDNFMWCGHNRAFVYFAESLRGGAPFVGTLCGSWEEYESGACDGNPTANMGFDLDLSTPEGRYYLYTNKDEPYAQG